jgi:hypothetical protein
MYESRTITSHHTNKEVKEWKFPLIVEFYEGSSAAVDHMLFQYTVKDPDVENYQRDALEILNDLRLYVQDNGWDLSEHTHEYIEKLSKIGANLYIHLFPRDIRQHISKQETETSKAGGLRPILSVPPDFKPFWEILYTGSARETQVQPGLFWGARYPLGRVLTDRDIKSHYVIDIGEGLLAGIHDDLKHSHEEIRALAHLLPKRQLVWLDSVLPKVEGISFGNLMDLLLKEDFDYGIIHFACHCHSHRHQGATKAYLRITVHDQDLDVLLSDVTRFQDFQIANHPFFFLNACETQSQGFPMQSLSFPADLLKLGAGGVIATACTIPDNFASVFAKVFYRQLFQRYLQENEAMEELDCCDESNLAEGEETLQQDWSEIPNRCIAEALTKTRRYFLEKYNNPLGLAYGLYAPSHQELHFS